MQYSNLGATEIEVSRLCLGTMTFGEQNSEADAHAQLNLAVEQGINFIDAAEMYPVPPRRETQGRTEKYIGNWLHARGNRSHLIIATKVSGPSNMHYIRGGPKLNRQHIEQALYDSLQRLRTDYIDLYQVHWPERSTNFFGRLGYTFDPESESVSIEEALETLAGLVEQGKIRTIGISNETPWGTMRYLMLSEKHHWPKIVSIQNPYNLLNRSYEIGLAEISHREQIGLLAYSPLAFGTLTGKYLNNSRPAGSRLSLFKHFDRYTNSEGIKATKRYVALAQEAGLDPAQMALAFINARPFVTSNIIGATTLDQLKKNIASMALQLDEDLLENIEKIHTRQPNPCP